MIQNPSDVPLLIQVLPLSLYPSPQTLVDLMSPSLAPDKSEYIEMDDMDVFTLQDLEKYSVSFLVGLMFCQFRNSFFSTRVSLSPKIW